MVIEIVTLENNHLYRGNALSEQHKLRFRSIVKRQAWDVPVIREHEYVQYDNPAAVYLIWRDADGIARGSSRLYPTDRPFMLKEVFSHMIQTIIKYYSYNQEGIYGGVQKEPLIRGKQ